jgi:hypothetical protein
MISATKKAPDGKLSIRATVDDHKILEKLRKKLGVDNSQLFRLGIRALAQKEGLSA